MIIRRRVLRNYRTMAPGRFHAFNQRVRKALTNNDKIPASTWATNPTLLQSYLSGSEEHDGTYHAATYGSKLDIAKRELLQAQIIDYLDEIALLLEGAALRNPEVLVSSGFDLAKERRSVPRTKAAQATSEDANSDTEHPSS